VLIIALACHKSY